ncbi:hypothetical protein JXL19_08070 [bacterium]|nr:hypothetical protein [bacterium]
MSKRLIVIAAIVLLLTNLSELSFSENSSSHKVTVYVLPVNEGAITKGNVTLAINHSNAGKNPASIEEGATCDLFWTSNGSDKKITVSSDNEYQNFTLKVFAENITGGFALPELTLNTMTADFITKIGSVTGKCGIRYRAFADKSDETGPDNHIITYTLTDL